MALLIGNSFTIACETSLFHLLPVIGLFSVTTRTHLSDMGHFAPLALNSQNQEHISSFH